MTKHYHLSEYSVNSTPVTGQYLAHAQKDRVKRAFIAADLHKGRCRLVAPTILQAAYLARVNVTYVHNALAQEVNRHDIEHGLLPLMRPSNGHTTALAKLPVINDAVVADIIRAVGVDHVLTIAAAVERNAA